jgi:hypothetical protein
LAARIKYHDSVTIEMLFRISKGSLNNNQ